MKAIKHDPPREIKDLRDMVQTSAAFFGDKDLYVYKEDKQEVHFSYNQLRDEVERFGTALNVLGIDEGPRCGDRRDEREGHGDISRHRQRRRRHRSARPRADRGSDSRVH